MPTPEENAIAACSELKATATRIAQRFGSESWKRRDALAVAIVKAAYAFAKKLAAETEPSTKTGD